MCCSPHQMTSCGSAGASFSLFSCSPWHSDVKVQTIGGPGGSEQAACAIERSLSRSICSHPSTGHACQRRPASTQTPLVATELPLSSLSAFTRCNLVHGTDRDSLQGLPPGPWTYRTGRRKVPPLQAKSLNVPLLLLFHVRGDSCCDSEESEMVLSLITVALSKPTEEPLQPSVDSDHLHRSAPLGSLEMAFVLRRRCLSCAFGIVQQEKKNFPHSARC